MLFREPDDDFIRTVHFEIQVPRIIRLLTYDRLPRQKVKFNRRNLFARDGNRCQYCGKKFPTDELSLDHVVPRSPRRKSDLGKYRLCVPAVQRPQGGTDASRSRNETDSRARRAQNEPGRHPQAVPP